MEKAKNILETIVVVNQAAGDGWKESPKRIIGRVWPVAIGVLKITDINKDYDKIKGKNVIGWGGDGTHGCLADLVRRMSPGAWYWPWDLGSVGDIPKSLGWGRLSDPIESGDEYIKRMARYWQKNILRTAEIVPGSVKAAGNEQAFLWTAGTGASAWVLHEIEGAREKKINKAGRLIRGATEYVRYMASKNTRIIDIKSGWEESAVWDVNVINSPFGRLGSLKLPGNNGLLWTITRPENKADRNRKIRLAFLDIALMKMGVNPSGQGVEIKKLNPSETVTIYNSRQRVQIDSELSKIAWGTEISLPECSDNPYRILIP
jgi:diacylglycerol kinase family enzyme